MYDILHQVILNGGYKLQEMLGRIHRLYALGEMDDAQLTEITALARANASPDAERPELLDMIRSLEARIAALEAAGKTESPDGAAEPWTPWDGISSQYAPGAVVTHRGETWRSTLTTQNVWEPGTVEFWVRVSE